MSAIVDNDGPIHMDHHRIDLENAMEKDEKNVQELQELIVDSPKRPIVETYVSPKSDTHEGIRLPLYKDNSDINSIFIKGADVRD